MARGNRVVARLVNGAMIKGTTEDFFPRRPVFHVTLEGSELVVEVRTRLLKAVFFVRELAGDTSRRDVRGFLAAPGETSHGKKLAVRFKDGELLCGYSLTFSPDREGFFMFPSDGGTNNLRVYVLTAATAEIKAGPAADALARRILGQEAA